jgi:hypothetical protein
MYLFEDPGDSREAQQLLTAALILRIYDSFQRNRETISAAVTVGLVPFFITSACQ